MLYGFGCSGLIRAFRFRLAVYGLGLELRLSGLGSSFGVSRTKDRGQVLREIIARFFSLKTALRALCN